MKKIRTFAVSAALLMSLTIGAQVKFGVKGGVDLAELKLSSVSDAFQPKNCVGWFAGPTLEVLSSNGLGFDISALYNQRESDWDILIDVDGSKMKPLKTKQIVVPLNVRYAIGLGDTFNIFGYAGPQVAFRIGDEVQKLADLKDEVPEWRLKDSNFSVNVGAGITIDRLQLSANYNVGVGRTGEVTWRDATHAALDGSKKNYKGSYKSWQISLVYFF